MIHAFLSWIRALHGFFMFCWRTRDSKTMPMMWRLLIPLILSRHRSSLHWLYDTILVFFSSKMWRVVRSSMISMAPIGVVDIDDCNARKPLDSNQLWSVYPMKSLEASCQACSKLLYGERLQKSVHFAEGQEICHLLWMIWKGRINYSLNYGSCTDNLCNIVPILLFGSCSRFRT